MNISLVAQSLLGLSVAAAQAAQLNFAGVPFAPGTTVRANVPLSAKEKAYAVQGGNVAPETAVAVLATPANFDPKKTWPVLVVCSTSDNQRQNRDDLVDFYRRICLSEGWVALAGDGPQRPRSDTAGWRGAMTLAAIDGLRRSFAGAQNWPIACAGFSGGGKCVGAIAPLLARSGCRIIGLYLTGINEDSLSPGYTRAAPGADFLSTPIYFSIGSDDRIAPVEKQYAVIASMKHTGFQRIRFGTFRGGHEGSDAQTSIALRWFRALEDDHPGHLGRPASSRR